jgi:hypothetical protein
MRIVSQYTLDPARGADYQEPLPAAFRVHRSDPETMSPEDQAIAILEDHNAAANTRLRTRRDGYT